MILGLKDALAKDRQIITKTYTIGGKRLTFETGRLALFASGSVVIRDEDGNFLLTTAGIGNPKDGDFFPLTVEYQEKYYASGKIGGNRFQKREGRPSEAAILNSRLIDRPIRPMFPKGTRTEVQIISTIMSSSGVSDFGFFGITGASLSLILAGVTDFEGPIAGVRIAVDANGNFLFDPSFSDLAASPLDLTIAGTADAITMVESQGKEVDNEMMIRAFEFGHGIIRELCEAQTDFLSAYTAAYALPTMDLAISEENPEVAAFVGNHLESSDFDRLYGLGKIEFHDAIGELVDRLAIAFAETFSESVNNLDDAKCILDENGISISEIADEIKSRVKDDMRAKILAGGTRLDGRTPSEVRPVSTDVALLPRTHGSGLFERGVTQVLSVTTLG